MRLKWWIVLFWLFLFVQGVSFTDHCGEIKNKTGFPGETVTLDIHQDGVKENALVDGNGNDIARINKTGKLKILNKNYTANLSSTNFSFNIKCANIEGQRKYTANVLYENGAHCLQDYLVTVRGDQICSEPKNIDISLDSYFTLDFDPDGVEEITWIDGTGKTIAITKDKAKLQILHSDYEGYLSTINVSLRNYNTTIKGNEKYTAKVIFHNGTRCHQDYCVQGYQRYYLFIPDKNTLKTYGIFVILIVLGFIFKKIFSCLKNKRKNCGTNRNNLKTSYIQTEKDNMLELVTLTSQRTLEQP